MLEIFQSKKLENMFYGWQKYKRSPNFIIGRFFFFFEKKMSSNTVCTHLCLLFINGLFSGGEVWALVLDKHSSGDIHRLSFQLCVLCTLCEAGFKGLLKISILSYNQMLM